MHFSNLLKLYYGLFHSIANYGIITWGGACKTVLNSLSSIQSKIIKIIFRNVNTKNKPLTIKQNFLLLSVLHEYELLSNLYLNSNSKTRNQSIILPKHSLKITKKQYKYKAIIIFNTFPVNMKTLKSMNKKSKTKRKSIIDHIKNLNLELYNL